MRDFFKKFFEKEKGDYEILKKILKIKKREKSLFYLCVIL